MSECLPKEVANALKSFDEERRISSSSGRLSVALAITHRLLKHGLPFPLDALKTKGKGQVAGVGGPAVKKILLAHGITRTLAAEGGRTSRGNMGLIEAYVALLNDLHKRRLLGSSTQEIDRALGLIESHWISGVRSYFDRQKIPLRVDMSLSIGEIVSEVLNEGRLRQQQRPGVMVEGIVLQHMVGAKLTLMVPDARIAHRAGASGDAQAGQPGDFQIGDTVIHVTTTPNESLMEKCRANLDAGLRPLVVCPSHKLAAAAGLAENAEIAKRVDIYSAETFISANLNERARFEAGQLPSTVSDFVKVYNEIITQCEADQSLQFEEAK